MRCDASPHGVAEVENDHAFWSDSKLLALSANLEDQQHE